MKRDEVDADIVRIGKALVKSLDKVLPYEELMLKYPAVYRKPLHLVLSQELQCYRSLLLVMKKSVKNMVDTISGTATMVKVSECKLWTNIQNNNVPDVWYSHSFLTAHTTLAGFLIELT